MELPPEALTAIGAIVVAILGALLGAGLNARAKVSEGLRTERLEAYPKLWALTGTFSRWPTNDGLDWGDLSRIHLEFRKWYFEIGGMFLSDRSRKLYGDVQELITWLLIGNHNGPLGRLSTKHYVALMRACSSLRTAMSQDVETRAHRPTWNFQRRLSRDRWYRTAHAENVRQIAAARVTATDKVLSADQLGGGTR